MFSRRNSAAEPVFYRHQLSALARCHRTCSQHTRDRQQSVSRQRDNTHIFKSRLPS